MFSPFVMNSLHLIAKPHPASPSADDFVAASRGVERGMFDILSPNLSLRSGRRGDISCPKLDEMPGEVFLVNLSLDKSVSL